MSQNTTPVTPWTGNPVITGYIVSGIVAGIVYFARSKGHEIDPENQNVLIDLLSGPVGEVVAFGTALIMAAYSRARAYSELSVNVLTGEDRPAVQRLQGRR